MIKIALFYFKNFNFLKFETLSPKPHPLTLNHKSKLVNTRVKIHFYPLPKFILIKSILLMTIFYPLFWSFFSLMTIFVTKT